MEQRNAKLRRVSLILTIALLLVAIGLMLAQRGSPNIQLVLVDRLGTRTPVGPLPGATFAPRISPDGLEIVFDTQDDGSIWIAKLSDLTAKRRLTSEGFNRGPMWSGDGKRILYITDDQDLEALFWRPADGSGIPELLTKPARAPESWSPQRPGFSFITLGAAGDYDVWTFSLSDRKRSVFADLPGSPQHSSHYSPDGRWMASMSRRRQGGWKFMSVPLSVLPPRSRCQSPEAVILFGRRISRNSISTTAARCLSLQ